jgi:O-antigen ligase
LFSETGEMSSFLSANFSVIHHPTYLSAFAAMCSALLIYGLKMKWDYYSQHRVIALFVMFVVVQFFCISLAGILFLLMYLIYLTFSRVREVLSKRMFVGFTIAVFITLFCIVRFTPDVGDQLVNSVDYLIEYVDDPEEFIKSKQTSIGGSETRLILWTAAFYVYLENPFGVGTANVDDYMTDMLYRIGQPHMAVKKLNPHNQYLQTAVEIGSVGLLILCSIIFYGCYYAIKKKNWILLFVILNLAFNCLFESMLQRQSGIVFYTFWICLLAPVKLNPKNELVKG